MAGDTSCPKCFGRVSLPEGAEESAWVRCPLCGAEYPVRQALDYQPPVLELIGEPGASVPGRTAAGSAALAGAAAEQVSSSSTGDESDVITFDDSLLLDEPTEEIPAGEAAAQEPQFGKTAPDDEEPDDFYKMMSSESLPPEQSKTDDESIEWMRDDDLISDDEEVRALEEEPMPDEEFRLADDDQQPVTFEPAAAAAIGPPPIGLPPRRRSRRRNPVMMAIGWFAGGFLGLALGYGILMWAFSPPRDPLNLAPKLPSFLVPAALRAPSSTSIAQSSQSPEDSSPDSGDTGLTTDDSTTFDPSGRADQAVERTEAKDLMPDATTDAAKGDNGVDSIAEPPIDPLTGDAAKSADEESQISSPKADITIDPAKDPLADPFGDTVKTDARKPATTDQAADPFAPQVEPLATTTDSAKGESTTTDTTADPLADPFATTPRSTAKIDPFAEPAEALGPTADTKYTSDELMTRIEAARTTTEAALAFPADAAASKDKNDANLAYYVNLSKVAEAVTFAAPDSDEQAQQSATTAAIDAILDAVPDQPKLEELGKLAGYWITKPKGNGIVLSGIVKESKEQGKLTESIVQTLGKPARGDPPLITVVSSAPLTDDPSRPVLVAGTIVRDPAKNLRGYQGAAETVVWSAIAVDPTKQIDDRSKDSGGNDGTPDGMP